MAMDYKGIMRQPGETHKEHIARVYKEALAFDADCEQAIADAELTGLMPPDSLETLRQLRGNFMLRTGILLGFFNKEDS